MKKLPDFRQVRSWITDFRRDLIRMMRLRFILVAMSILIVVFIIMLTSINMIMKTVSASQSMRLLEQIAESDRYNRVESVQPGMFEDVPPSDGSGESRPPEPPDKPEETTENAAAEMVYAPEGGIVSLSWGEGPWGWDGQWQPQQPDDSSREERKPPDEQNPGQRPTDNYMPPPWWWQPGDDSHEDDHDSDDDDDDDDERRPTDRQVPSEPPPPPPEEQHVTEKPTQAPVQQDVTEAPAQRETAPPTELQTTEAEETTERPEPPVRETFVPEPRDPRPDRWNVSVTIDHFAIMADAEGNFLGLRNTEDYTEDEAKEILAGILAGGKEKGMYGWLQYCRAEKSYGTLLVITDKTSDQGLLNNLFRLTVVVGILMLLVLLVILIFLSKKITEPVQTAFTRQKQFVSDAGHELKTPIAVLTANADILQDEIGENKWLGYMQEQIGRMNQLVGDLLRLARMDNATQEYDFKDFDLSMAVAATTLPFESAAFEQHRNLEMDVQPDLIYHGSEQHIRQLCAIFIDNALKYSNENGTIKVTLLQRGEHSVLEFYNTGCEISPAETEKIFERFYRGDKARNNQGKSGYGLGLAIAKSIMDVHRIRIQVTCEQGRWIRFLLTL